MTQSYRKVVVFYKRPWVSFVSIAAENRGCSMPAYERIGSTKSIGKKGTETYVDGNPESVAFTISSLIFEDIHKLRQVSDLS